MEEAERIKWESVYEDGSLAARIEAAFKDIQYPGDDQLVPDPTHWEGGDIAKAFAGWHWKTIPLDVLSLHLAGLSYFTPEAFRYYLPAYLLAALRRLSPAEIDTRAADIPETLVHKLTPPKQEGLVSDDFRARMSGLTQEQKTVIRDFVRWWNRETRETWAKILPGDALGSHGEDEDETALREYWEGMG